MKPSLFSIALAGTIALSAPVHAEPINVSYQPALMWSLPLYIATEKGWWKEIGLEPTFSVFPAGPQQLATIPSKSWDVGATGSPISVLGAARFNLLTIAIGTDQSDTAAVVARAADAEAFMKNPALLKGKDILLTTNTTGEYTAFACLKKFGLVPADMKVVNLAPAQTIAAYSSGNGTVAAAWPPYSYTLQEKANAKVICNGREGGAAVTTTLVVREDYAKEKPEMVAKYVALYLRAITWEKKNRKGTMDYMRVFYPKGGTTLSDKFIEIDYDRSPIFTLDEQLKLFDRSEGASTADKWHDGLAEYLKATGTIAKVPDTGKYITDKFLKMVAADPKLRAFANGE